MDINKVVTLGVSVYDFNQPDFSHADLYTGSPRLYATKVIYASALLLKEKKIKLQPYVLSKLNSYTYNLYRGGLFMHYKALSLNMACSYLKGSKESVYDFYTTVGLACTYKKVKFGYSLSSDWNQIARGRQHEIFFAFNLFSQTQPQRNLMLN